MDLLEPWYVPENLARLETQLANETPSGHVLEGMPVRALAQREDCDDVLFELLDGSQRVAVVHLTYAHNVDRAWPRTHIFRNLSEWLEGPMRMDHSKFNA